MEQLDQYNSYTYDPKRGGHNLFTPIELANLRAVDRRFNKMDPRVIENQRRYLERHREEIYARERARRARKRMDADAPERGGEGG